MNFDLFSFRDYEIAVFVFRKDNILNVWSFHEAFCCKFTFSLLKALLSGLGVQSSKFSVGLLQAEHDLNLEMRRNRTCCFSELSEAVFVDRSTPAQWVNRSR
jgi:hypothetical protein